MYEPSPARHYNFQEAAHIPATRLISQTFHHQTSSSDARYLGMCLHGKLP